MKLIFSLFLFISTPVFAQGFATGYVIGSSSCESCNDKDKRIKDLEESVKKKDNTIRDLNDYIRVQQKTINRMREELKGKNGG